MKMARPYQRVAANFFDAALLAFIIYNTYKYFDVKEMLPKEAQRHHYFVSILYYYFILTILPHQLFGQSIGQAITGIKVVSSAHKPLPFTKIIMRDLLRPTSLVVFGPVVNKRARTWYDTFLNSTIVDIR